VYPFALHLDMIRREGNPTPALTDNQGPLLAFHVQPFPSAACARGYPPDDTDHVSKPYTTTYAVRIARKTGTGNFRGRHNSTILSNFVRVTPKRNTLFLFDFVKIVAAVSTFLSTIRIDIRCDFFLILLNISQLEGWAWKVQS